MTKDEATLLREVHSNLTALIAVHKSCNQERIANSKALNGNGTDGLKSRVTALETSSRLSGRSLVIGVAFVSAVASGLIISVANAVMAAHRTLP